MYLWFSFIMFLTGGAMAMVIRAELFQPGLQIVEPAFFNQMTTMHGLIMVFGCSYAGFCRAGKLDDSHDDRGTRYGYAPYE